MADKIKVLFLCQTNTGRSQLAEAWLRKVGGYRFEVYSAGSEPGVELDPIVRQMLEDGSFDVSKHQPKRMSDFLDKEFDFIISIADDSESDAPDYPHDNMRIIWHFADPSTLNLDDARRQRAFRYISSGLEMRVRLFVNLWRDGDRRSIIALRTKLLEERLLRMRQLDTERDDLFDRPAIERHRQQRAALSLLLSSVSLADRLLAALSRQQIGCRLAGFIYHKAAYVQSQTNRQTSTRA